jgi:hypothetical protein
VQPPPSEDVLAQEAIVDEWPAPVRITRCHPHLYGSAQLDKRSDANSRFSTIRSARTVIPVLYGGEDDFAAASETIFHTVDTPGGAHRPRRVVLDKYLSWQWSEIITTRAFRLIRLDGDGLTALGTTRNELIEGGRLTYPDTRSWATAVAAALPDIDGMWWQSRQAPDRWAVVLFGHIRRRPGGVRSTDVTADSPAVPFLWPPGTARLDLIADALDITVVRS